jgi:hypothetical protein
VVDAKKIMELLRTHFNTEGNVSIDDEGLVSCTGDVELKTTNTKLPVHFGKVDGHFWCFTNSLISLDGAPHHVGDSFDCSENQLTSLTGAPSSVGKNFECHRNELTSLVGAPTTVGRTFWCSDNQLTSLVGAPTAIGGDFWCYNNPLDSLDGIPTQLHTLYLTFSPTLPLLRSLYAKKIDFYPHDEATVQEILNRYAGEGKRGAIRCQKELIAAGFEGNAKW